MTKIELLLPAGNFDCLKAAVENGADAVYFGIRNFNARRRADNFSIEEAKKAIDYCHQNGVRAYCTLNILIKNSEIQEFFETVKDLYLAGIDAVIIQHISFVSIIKKNFPDLDVHLSTQSSISNSYFYDLIKDADRIILPREFCQDEIRNFVKKTKIPVEIFVQGALCFSYSGKCLFSSFLGGRSGNRGLCAQPCRKKYNHQYLLSMKDLCLIEKIPEIIESGVSSLKVEGRLRSPKYVASAARAYRTAIDSYHSGKFRINPDLVKSMKLSFNREFTEGYFSKETDLVAPEQPLARGLFLGTLEKDNLILLQEDLSLGDGLGIWFQDRVDGAVLRKMDKDGKPITEAKAGDKVKIYIRAPVGTKIYQTSSVKESEKISFEKRKPITIIPRKVKELILPEIKPIKSNQEELLVKVYSKTDAETALKNGADKVFYNLFAEDFDPRFGAFIPRILTDAEIEKAVELVKKFKVKDLLIGDFGVYAKLKNKKDLNLYLDYSANVFNDYDLDFFENSVPIISPELSFSEVTEFKNKNFAVLSHGRIVLMNTKYQKLPKQLKDEKNYTFPVRKEHSYYQILNSLELGLFDEILKLKSVGTNRFFLDLDNQVAEKVKLYRDLMENKKIQIQKSGHTKGHFEKSVI